MIRARISQYQGWQKKLNLFSRTEHKLYTTLNKNSTLSLQGEGSNLHHLDFVSTALTPSLFGFHFVMNSCNEFVLYIDIPVSTYQEFTGTLLIAIQNINGLVGFLLA